MNWTIRRDGKKVFIDGQGMDGCGAIIEVGDNRKISLYEIPLYEGTPQFSGIFDNIIEAMEKAESWTSGGCK